VYGLRRFNATGARCGNHLDLRARSPARGMGVWVRYVLAMCIEFGNVEPLRSRNLI
jgi:hypothetical protein